MLYRTRRIVKFARVEVTMKKKVLMVANVASSIQQFNMSNIQILQNRGYEVHVAANFEKGSTTSDEHTKEFREELLSKGITVHHLPIVRHTGLNKSNMRAYKMLKDIIIKNKYSLIHCHTALGSVLTRLAARRKRKNGTKVISTAHGFLFFKGAPLKNWLLYYPIERLLARYTDVLITINKEDYNRAKKSFKAGKVEYIPGVGIDAGKFSEVVVDKSAKRRELGIPAEGFVVLSVGELNKNKNHETVIKAIAKLNNPNVYYVICGQGALENYLKDLIKKIGLEKQVKILGYRRDIAEINKASDVFAFPSKREGLGLAALEAMASGLPLITSNIHGIVDYAIDGVTAYCYSPTDIDGVADGISRLANDSNLRNRIGKYNIEAVKKFDIKTVKEAMKVIYKNI